MLLLLYGVVVFVVVASAAPPTTTNATTSEDCLSPSECGLNGCIVNSVCVCDPGWVGSECSVLDLAPAQIQDSYIPADGVSSSWGMSVVKTNDTYHGYVSEFLYKCNLDSWGSNSYINHVVAPTPTGPWTHAPSGPAVGVWAHNPRTYNLFFHVCCFWRDNVSYFSGV